MPRGSHAKGGLRSHRRRIGKHLVIAPWVIIAVVAAVVLAGLSAGYVFLITRGCDGPTVTATVVADSDIADTITQQAGSWRNTNPTVDGHCAAISVQPKDSALAAAAMAPTWDPRTDGPRPDVWIPESSLWSQLAASRQDAARMLPTRQPSLARSPAVIAMPAPMAKAIGGAAPKITWKQFAAYAGNDWTLYHHPEWGGFKMAVTDPAQSTAGLLGLTSMITNSKTDQLSADQRRVLNQLWTVKSDYQSDVGSLLQKLTAKDQISQKAALQEVSAFPALERDVAEYNGQTPRVRLAAVYPSDGSADADFPYLVLNWSHADPHTINQAAQQHRDNVAGAFLTYLKGPDSRAKFLAAGYRDANRRPGAELTPANGVPRTVPTLPRPLTTPDAISQTVSAWTAISRPTNVLIVMDTSADMGTTVAGTDKTKLQIAGSATAEAIQLFGSQAKVGLWTYATDLDGTKDYNQIVPVGGVNTDMSGTPRLAKIRSEMTNLNSGGDPGLYSTTAAAFASMRAHYVEGAVNQIVLITGSGRNAGGAGLASLTATLTHGHDKNHPLPIMTVGYGKSIDMTALQAISQASGGRTYTTASPSELDKLLLTALYSATPPPSN